MQLWRAVCVTLLSVTAIFDPAVRPVRYWDASPPPPQKKPKKTIVPLKKHAGYRSDPNHNQQLVRTHILRGLPNLILFNAHFSQCSFTFCSLSQSIICSDYWFQPTPRRKASHGCNTQGPRKRACAILDRKNNSNSFPSSPAGELGKDCARTVAAATVLASRSQQLVHSPLDQQNVIPKGADGEEARSSNNESFKVLGLVTCIYIRAS
jgi:hypothetical protein